MKHKIEIAPNIAIYIDGERVIGSKPHGLFLITEMIVSDEDLKRLADRCLEVIAEQTEPSNSENPNNCEHITEDGVTCAKYPACDDCLDNPLNKIKGSERLLKGSDPLHDDCFDCDKFFTCDNKGDDYKTDCPWK